MAELVEIANGLPPMRLIVTRKSPCLEPLEDLLLAMQQQSIVGDFSLLVVDDESEMSQKSTNKYLGPGGVKVKRFKDGSIEEIDFHQFQLTLTSGYQITHLVLADTFGGELTSDRIEERIKIVHEIVGRLEESLALREASLVTFITKVNLLIPAAEEASLPNIFQLVSRDGADAIPWINVVALPEIQIEYGKQLVPVPSDSSYVAHAAISLVAASGLWDDPSSDHDPKQLFRHNSQAISTNCFLVRSKGRFAIAPELPARVFSQAFRREPGLPVENDQNTFQRLSQSDSQRVIERCLEVLTHHHHLGMPDTSQIEEILAPQTKVGFKQLFKIFFSWLIHRLPVLIKEDVEEKVESVKTWAREKTDELLGGSATSLTTNDVVETISSHQLLDLDLVARHVSPEPQIWNNLRRVALGLVDGSELPLELEAVRSAGKTRFIIGNRSAVVQRPGPNEKNHSSLISNFQLLLNQTKLNCEERVGIIRSLINEEAERAKAEEEELAIRLSKGIVRRIFNWLVKRIMKLLLFMTATFALVLLPFLVPIAQIASVIWAGVGAVILLVSMVRRLGQYLKKKFIQDFRRGIAKQLATVLKAAESILVTQIERVKGLAEIGEDWQKILSVVVHEPYGAQVRNPRPRIRNHFLHLPLSHQIVEPEISEPRLRGLVQKARQESFGAGWLSNKYLMMEKAAMQELTLVSGQGNFAPDNSPANSHNDNFNHRERLMMSIKSGSSRKFVEYEARRRAQELLLEVSDDGVSIADTLFTSTGLIQGLMQGDGGTSVSMRVQSFLDQIVDGTVSPPNLGLFDTGAEGARELLKSDLGFKIKDSIHIGPAPIKPLNIEQIASPNWKADFGNFMFARINYEISDPVPIKTLKMFSEQPQAAEIDLTYALTQWKMPTVDDEFELIPEEEDDQNLIAKEVPNLPGDADPRWIISPDQSITEPVKSGPYKYLGEYDGVPARWPMSNSEHIRFRVRSKAGPSSAFEMIQSALKAVANVTGYSFEFAGTFEHVPKFYEDQETIDIGWATRSEFLTAYPNDSLEKVVGRGGPQYRVGENGAPEIYSGMVIMNAAMNMPAIVGPGLTQYMVLLHELGHVMNLDHVQSRAEVMYPIIGLDKQFSWGPGDQQGLYYLARS